jgi:uncharacterized protein with GYD domain
VASQAPDLRECEIGITPFDCPRDNNLVSRGFRSRPVADAFGAPVLRDQGSDRPAGHGKTDQGVELLGASTLDRLLPPTLTWPGHSGQRRQDGCFGEFLPAQERSRSMPTYVSLVNWTEQGITNFRDTVRRGEDVRGLVEKSGGQLRLLLWTLGEYDVVSVIDFPADETATAVLLQIGAGGNVRTKTMKAFDAEQMSAIIQRTG